MPATDRDRARLLHETGSEVFTQNHSDSTLDRRLFTAGPGSEYEQHLAAWPRRFNAAWPFLAPKLEQAQHDADYWYIASKWTPAALAQRQRAASLQGKRVDWHRVDEESA